MISEYQFEKFIEGLRIYKFLLSRIYGHYVYSEFSDSPMEQGYDFIVESFISMSLNDETASLCEIIDNNCERYNYISWEIFDCFVKCGYTYTIILEHDDESYEPVVSDHGIKIENIHEFYNYWVLGEEPANKPLTPAHLYDSQAEQQIMLSTYKNFFAYNFPNAEFTF